MTERLHDLVARVLSVPAARISEQTGARTVDPWTSLQHLQLVAAVEDAHGIRFTAAEARLVRTVADLRAVLRDRGVTD